MIDFKASHFGVASRCSLTYVLISQGGPQMASSLGTHAAAWCLNGLSRAAAIFVCKMVVIYSNLSSHAGSIAASDDYVGDTVLEDLRPHHVICLRVMVRRV